MFCPRCGHYLNRNVVECPYCGKIIPRRNKNYTETVEEWESDHGHSSESCAIGDGRSSNPSGKAEALFNINNRNFMVGIIGSVLLTISMFLPWTYWAGSEVVVYYSALDMVGLPWSNMEIARLYPVCVSLLGALSIFLLLFARNSRFGLYCIFAIGLFDIIGCVLFAYGSVMFTGMKHFVGLGVALLGTIMILSSSTRLIDKFYGIEHKKK